MYVAKEVSEGAQFQSALDCTNTFLPSLASYSWRSQICERPSIGAPM
jgi:hypothetical protein